MTINRLKAAQSSLQRLCTVATNGITKHNLGSEITLFSPRVSKLKGNPLGRNIIDGA
jgi:hypothetical protein